MIHYPTDLLRLDLSQEERSALVKVLQNIVLDNRKMKEESTTNRMINHYHVAETKAEEILATLEESSIEVMVADSVRWLRNVSLRDPVAHNAAKRIWESEAVNR